jgi:hypothetical protein
MRAKQVLVFISAASGRATPIPPELISRMHRFAVDLEPEPPKKPRASKQARAAGSRSR